MRRPAVVALVGLLLAPGAATAAPLLDVLLARGGGPDRRRQRHRAGAGARRARLLPLDLGHHPPGDRTVRRRAGDPRRGRPDRHQRRAGADRAGLDGGGRAPGRRRRRSRAGSRPRRSTGPGPAGSSSTRSSRARFFEARFAAFVFPDEAAIDRALGAGEHDEAAREAARARLVREAAERALADWLQEARRRTSVRILLSPGASIAPPFPPPVGHGPERPRRSDGLGAGDLAAGRDRLAWAIAAADGLPHRVEQFLVVERLGEEIDGAGLHRPHGHRDVAVAGDEDDRDVRPEATRACCRSSPFWPGMRMSSTRQRGLARSRRSRNSRADPNVITR